MGGRICKQEYTGACRVGVRRVGVHRGNSSQHHALLQHPGPLGAELPPSTTTSKRRYLCLAKPLVSSNRKRDTFDIQSNLIITKQQLRLSQLHSSSFFNTRNRLNAA